MAANSTLFFVNFKPWLSLGFAQFFELFFCKKIPLSRRVEYVKDGSMDHSVSE